MQSFIRELYFGDIDPQAKSFDHNSDFGKALDIIAKNEEQLTDILEGKQKKLFLDFVNAYGEAMGIAVSESYVDGFRTGAAFTIDAFANTD